LFIRRHINQSIYQLKELCLQTPVRADWIFPIYKLEIFDGPSAYRGASTANHQDAEHLNLRLAKNGYVDAITHEGALPPLISAKVVPLPHWKWLYEKTEDRVILKLMRKFRIAP
jgi:hypothetical protein